MDVRKTFLKDEELNSELIKKGFAVLSFLTDVEADKLRELYFEYHEESEVNGLYVSSHIKDWNTLIEISEKIKTVLSTQIDKFFINVQKIGGTFIAKAKDDANILHPHQDWSIVDEQQFRSFSIWIATQDTNDQNGCLYVLPGSHEWVRGYRHISIPSVYGKIYDLTWKYMVPVHLKKGEAIVFDHALVHASLPNKTDVLRIAVTHTLLSNGATFRISCNNNGLVEEYECPQGFYVKPEAKTPPFDLKKVKVADFKMVQLDEKTFINFAEKESLKSRSVSKNFFLNFLKWGFR